MQSKHYIELTWTKIKLFNNFYCNLSTKFNQSTESFRDEFFLYFNNSLNTQLLF
jgi:hypothetical protein